MCIDPMISGAADARPASAVTETGRAEDIAAIGTGADAADFPAMNAAGYRAADARSPARSGMTDAAAGAEDAARDSFSRFPAAVST